MSRNPLALLTVLLSLASPVAAAEDPTATLPLAEVLRLYKEENAAKAEEKDPRPPRAATVSKLELSGRLLDGAIQVTAQVEVVVLAGGDWVTVPLFQKDKSTNIARLPTVKGGVFSIVGGYLSFLTDEEGTYAFEVSLLKTAQSAGPRQRVEIGYHDAALAVLKLRLDENLFRLVHGGEVEDSDGLLLYPDGNRFVVQWERTAAARTRSPEKATRPPIESVITAGHASVVSTLDGRTVTRLLYELRSEGRKAIAFTLPDGQTLQKVFVNGAAVPFSVRERELRLEVAPARAGDESARLELVMTGSHGEYHLSGRLDYAFPSPSWGMNELHVVLSLPQVFNYQWAGGSLAPAESAPEAAYSHEIPTPGKLVYLHQQLLSTAASARITYTVDLSGSYFHGETAAASR